MSSKNVDELNNMREVILESFNFSMACTTLPSLSEGYFVGKRRLCIYHAFTLKGFLFCESGAH